MKYQAASSFDADFRRLTDRERELFRAAVRLMNEAVERRGDHPVPGWPAKLRVKAIQGAPGIWEMTWSFSGPDGRATFELVSIDGEPGIRWRRIGDRRVLKAP